MNGKSISYNLTSTKTANIILQDNLKRKELDMPVKKLLVGLALLLMSPSMVIGSQPGDVIKQYAVTKYAAGLAWDGKYIWLCDRDAQWIYAIEPSVGSIVDSLRCPAFSPLGLTFGGGYLWISEYDKELIYKVDLKEKRVVDVIGSPGSVTTGLAWHNGYLWASDASERKIFRLDPSDGTPLASIKAPSRYPSGLTFAGDYLWVSDRINDKIYLVEPENGWVILSFKSPGPYPRGLAFDGNYLWNVDYQTDSLYALRTSGDEPYVKGEPRRARVTFTFKARCQGPDPIERCDVYLALPHDDLEHQRLLSEIRYVPEPEDIVKDKWGQQFAHFVIRNVPAGEEFKVSYSVDAEISRLKYIIQPERVGAIEEIPKDLRQKYTVDGERLMISDPFIQKAIREAVGNETNPYWIARKIFEYVNAHVDYERVGGWDTAPTVLKRGTGSCSEYSFVFMALARGAGLPTRFCAGVVRRGDDASMDDVFHRWTEVYLPGYGWIPIDASAGDRPWQADAEGAIGGYSRNILITTIGGGDSEFLGWSYNCGYSYRYTGRSSLEVSMYADWEPLESK